MIRNDDMKKNTLEKLRKLLPADAGTKMLFICGFALVLSAAILISAMKVWRIVAPSFDRPSVLGESRDARDEDPFVTRASGVRPSQAAPVVEPGDQSLGDRNAPITLVAFGDYRCRFCGEQFQLLKDIYQRYSGRVRLVWKDYPDSDKASDSYRSAVAARCAGEQGKFWEYHQLLFEIPSFGSDSFVSLAGEIGLDAPAFTACLDSGRPDDMIGKNIREANDLGISGVPFVYVNKQEVMGQASIEEMERYIQAEMR
jgi:protein-disulfide isomerase